MSKRIVTVDFDGVIIEKLWGLDWVSQAKEKSKPTPTWIKTIDTGWRWLNHWWRKPIEGGKKGLMTLKSLGYEVILLTSREGHIRNVTYGWMKRWGYFNLYDKYCFNDRAIGGAKSKVERIKVLKPDVHIDDNQDTVELLSKTFPKMKIVFLNIGQSKMPVANNIIEVHNWEEICQALT